MSEIKQVRTFGSSCDHPGCYAHKVICADSKAKCCDMLRASGWQVTNYEPIKCYCPAHAKLHSKNEGKVFSFVPKYAIGTQLWTWVWRSERETICKCCGNSHGSIRNVRTPRKVEVIGYRYNVTKYGGKPISTEIRYLVHESSALRVSSLVHELQETKEACLEYIKQLEEENKENALALRLSL